MREYKKYKAVAPEETINKIRGILNTLGIFLKESSCEKDGLYACRLTINNDDLSVLNMGTNGKGRSYEYALASGYAEFMERLQNGIVYNQASLGSVTKMIMEKHNSMSPMKQKIVDLGLQREVVFDINETIWDTDTVIDKFDKDLRQLFHIKNGIDLHSQMKMIVKDTESLMVPVYSVTDREEVLYPINWALTATGSNGMCAGNTPSEAILQGMCEIFERYSATQIFFNHLTPPTIDLEVFKDTIVYNKLKTLMKRYNYEFIIKDCSLGKGLPVLGLLIIDRKNNTYNFKLGADFIPAIALERCLTEVYQSRQGFIGLSLFESKDNNYEHYSKMLHNGTGNWPESIFYAKPSYSFCDFNPSLGKDNAIDLKYACKLINDLGSNLYIRDNSYLGFPSYYIIAPGLSGVYPDIEALYSDMLADPNFIGSKYWSGINFETDLENLVVEVEFALQNNGFFNFNDLIPFYASKELKDLDPYLFLCMAYYKMGAYKKAYDNIRKFLNGKKAEYKYYFAASDYILLKYLNNAEDVDVESTLSKKYGKLLAVDVMNDMQSPKDIFKYYNFHKHFDWTNMIANKNSYFLRVLCLDKKLKQAISNTPIRQRELGTIFE